MPSESSPAGIFKYMNIYHATAGEGEEMRRQEEGEEMPWHWLGRRYNG
jgi:hypothetical protein